MQHWGLEVNCSLCSGLGTIRRLTKRKSGDKMPELICSCAAGREVAASPRPLVMR